MLQHINFGTEKINHARESKFDQSFRRGSGFKVRYPGTFYNFNISLGGVGHLGSVHPY